MDEAVEKIQDEIQAELESLYGANVHGDRRSIGQQARKKAAKKGRRRWTQAQKDAASKAAKARHAKGKKVVKKRSGRKKGSALVQSASGTEGS